MIRIQNVRVYYGCTTKGPIETSENSDIRLNAHPLILIYHICHFFFVLLLDKLPCYYGSILVANFIDIRRCLTSSKAIDVVWWPHFSLLAQFILLIIADQLNLVDRLVHCLLSFSRDRLKLPASLISILVWHQILLVASMWNLGVAVLLVRVLWATTRTGEPSVWLCIGEEVNGFLALVRLWSLWIHGSCINIAKVVARTQEKRVIVQHLVLINAIRETTSLYLASISELCVLCFSNCEKLKCKDCW